MEKISGEFNLACDEAKIKVLKISTNWLEMLKLFEHPEFIGTTLEEKKSEKRKNEFLAVRLALKELMGYEVEVIYNNEGKPFIANDTHQISISHSGEWVAVIAHPKNKVGIDIECPNKKIEKVYSRFLSLTEQQTLFGDGDVRKLYLAWSAKEALYKIIGREAVDFQNQLQILPFDITSNSGKMNAIHLPTAINYQLKYHICNDYCLVYSIEI